MPLLSTRQIIKLDSNDSNETINRKLQNKYNVNLFDLAYTLAIALTEQFIPDKFYGLTGEEIKYWKKKLKKMREELKAISSEGIIAKFIQAIRKFESEIPSVELGKKLSKKARLLLLWSRCLFVRESRWKTLKVDKEKYREVHKRMTGEDIEEPDIPVPLPRLEGTNEIVWNDYDTLIKWFFEKLKVCEYSKYFEIKSDKKEEITHARSNLQKNNKSHGFDADKEINNYMMQQRYFNRNKKESKERGHIKPFAVLKVEFKVNSIEIVNRIGDEFYEKEFKLIEGDYFAEWKSNLKKDSKIKRPIVIFPGEEEFRGDKYIQPFSPFHEGNLYFKKFPGQISMKLPKKNNTSQNN